MGIKISEMTPDTSIDGTELIPVSDDGSPKSVTIEGIKDFTVAAIQDITAGSAVATGNGLFALQDGVLQPVDIDLVTQRAIDIVWGKAAETSPASGSIVPLKQSGVEKTLTLSALAELVRATIEAPILDISDISGASTLSSADLILVGQGGVGKATTVGAINTAIYSALKDHVSGLTEVDSVAGSDVLYLVTGGVAKKTTVSSLLGAIGGSVIAPLSTTENNIPQWSSAQKTLKNGLSLQTAVRSIGSADDASVPSERAVRSMADGLVYAQTDIGADLADADLFLVDDGGAGTAQRKSALTRLWTYIWSKVSGATAKTTPVDADSIGIVDSAASSVVKNLTLANLFAYVTSKCVALTAKESPVAADSIVIKDSAAPTTLKLSTFTQAWNSVLSALAKALRLDEFAAANDNTTNDASAAAHGLMPKADKIRFDALTYSQTELAADPADPAEGKHVIWQSDGTGAGDDGDIMVKITAGGVTKTATLVDFSGIA